MAKSAAMLYPSSMNPRDQLTLLAIFEDPPQAIEWEAIEDLLVAVGCCVVVESENHVGFKRDGIIGSFQRPKVYNRPEPYLVRSVREYLVLLGEAP